ncbi:Ldh family oxidoreductase [Manganibacter manganicus]|uniref:Lactate dehydrogenase n=1 Tax=Manganibacter manganicus TaxID=1873176 RepID=A0A1V8RT85_9HYPH|nr:Ldh family oxidoreductase [Pseudaminobacter manganicus]OQM76421.1 lactate dehydrogenase [Pseudaminobacter manganicus]
MQLSLEQAAGLCRMAALGAGAGDETAQALASAAVSAEAAGLPSVGLAHLLDYLDALEAGRIDGKAEPVVTRPALAVYLSDARRGVPHLGFERTLDDLAKAARLFGVAIFAQKNAYTCGRLGHFVARLAERGLAALAATNGPALLAGSGSTRPVYCTNPLAFAAPSADGAPLIIDQASSATAFVNIRKAAKQGEEIPDGWAVDADGQPTTDPAAAMKGALLAFGGPRGANIALMVEVLAAGLTGANWSLDAPAFATGSESPGTGLFVLAMEPKLLDPGFEQRLADQLGRLRAHYGVHIPGRAAVQATQRATSDGLNVPKTVVQRLSEFAGRYSA